MQKSEARDWVNLDKNDADFLSQMELGQGNCIPQWSEWTERISGEDKVRHIKEWVILTRTISQYITCYLL